MSHWNQKLAVVMIFLSLALLLPPAGRGQGPDSATQFLEQRIRAVHELARQPDAGPAGGDDEPQGLYTWQIEAIPGTADANCTFALVLDAADRPHVAYCDYDKNLHYGYYDGAAWHVETVTAAGMVSEPLFVSLALDRAGRPHLAYSGYAGRLYQLRRGLYALAPPFQKTRPHPFLV
ncbi:MAG: hypothetical protein KKA73_12020, partial [Chloroflexi bacterium]|nr:hypothetical protein [Chloroflexota bacterium]